jgi:hypothetical protein
MLVNNKYPRPKGKTGKPLQRPDSIEYQHYLLRNVPRALMQKVLRKCRILSRPPVSVRQVTLTLLERFVEDVELPPSKGQIILEQRSEEQSF